MSALVARLAARIDRVLGLDSAPRPEVRDLPCNMFSCFMIFGWPSER